MSTEVVRRKTWRPGTYDSWVVAGQSTIDAAYWLFHIRRQSAKLHASVKARMSNTIADALEFSPRVLIAVIDEGSPTGTALAIRSARGLNPDLSIVIWAPRIASEWSVIFLEAGACLVIDRREDVSPAIERLLKVGCS